VIVYQLFTGKVPFLGEDQEETFELIKKGDFIFPEDVPEQAQDLIRKLLV